MARRFFCAVRAVFMQIVKKSAHCFVEYLIFVKILKRTLLRKIFLDK